jgi:hypothetical protein
MAEDFLLKTNGYYGDKKVLSLISFQIDISFCFQIPYFYRPINGYGNNKNYSEQQWLVKSGRRF